MEKNKKDQVRPGSVDGIQEFDNPLPAWWVGLFYLTIVLGIAYVIYKYPMQGESLIEAYNKELVAIQESKQLPPNGGAESEGAAPVAVGTLNDRVQDPAMIAAGKEIFVSYCAPCHGPDGGGVIGPNLTDHYFLHGKTPEQIVKVIADGVVEKGMASWKPTLGDAKVEQAAAYVLSLIGTTPVTAQAPQGELIQ